MDRSRRKLLVASVGVAAISYVVVGSACSDTTVTSGNLPAPVSTSPTSGNLPSPPARSVDDAGDAGDGGDAGDAGDAGDGGDGSL